MEQQQFDSESYWHRSASKAFSFDDDIDDVYQELNATSIGQGSVLNDDAISEASFDNRLSSGAVGVSLNALISEDTLKTLLIEQTLDDRIVTKGVTPEEELKLLRRHLQTTLYMPSPAATAQKLLEGKIVPLEAFKSLHEKKQLLDAVLACGNAGDAIIAVLLFLEKTLNTSNFHALLKERPRAFRQYLNYLKYSEPQAAIALLKVFNKHSAAALLQFHEAITSTTRATRKQKLHLLMEQYSKNPNVPAIYQQIFHANFKLLDLLDKEQGALGHLALNVTPIEVLYACCRKYNSWKEQDLEKSLSPYRFAAEQQISPAQFEWTALNERASSQAYADLEYIFERVPSWHPMNKKQFHISFALEAAIIRLHRLKAPDAVLYLFLTKMSNHTEKLELARRVQCTKAIIDALASLKDVQQLTELKGTLADRSEEQFYCERALKNLQTKRWSTDNIKIKL